MFENTLRVLDEILPEFEDGCLIGDMTDRELREAIIDQQWYLDTLLNPWTSILSTNCAPLTTQQIQEFYDHLQEVADAKDYLNYLLKAYKERN